MDTLHAISDFVEFYLSPDQSLKNIEFTQLKLHRKAQSLFKKSSDELLLKVSCFRESLNLLKNYRKVRPHGQHPSESNTEKLYRELTQLSPEDCLILIAKDRYQLGDSQLSLILKKSEESVSFRRSQLLQHLGEESISFEDPSTISPKAFVQPVGSHAPHRPNRSIYQAFQSLPFAIRFSVETLSVLFTLVFLMLIIPEIRNTYENSVQKRINDYLIESSLVDSPAPAGTSKEAKAVATPAPEDEAEAEATPAELSAASKKQPKVNEGETWRFSFTGSMTNEIESGILSILKDSGLDQYKPLTVPGGIQFDFMIPIANLIPLKTSLEDMTSEIQRKSPSSRQNMMGSANMSWYKRKMLGGRKIPGGHVQVMIWISTL